MNSRISIGIVILGIIILSSFLGCDHPLESEVLKSVIETIAADHPSTPTDLQATAVNNRMIDLTWTYDSPYESGFTLQRKTGTGSFADLAALGADANSYSDTTAVPGTQYTYRVRAFDGGGSSEWSNEAGAVTEIYAYLALNSGKIAVIEISDPENPGAPVYRTTGGYPNTIEIHDSHVYVPILQDMAIIDVTDPTDPGDPVFVDYGDAMFFVRYVALKDNYAYVTLEPYYLLIFDIATPSSPSFITQKSYSPPAAPSDVAIYGNYLYLATSGGLFIFDISNGALPSGPTNFNANGATKIGIDGNRAYMMFDPEDLGVYRLDSPLNPSYLGVREFTGTAQDIAAQGDYVFMACGDQGLIVVDVSDMSDVNPPLAAREDTNNAYGVAIIDNYALIADGGGGLAVIDITTPMSPGTPTYITTYGNVRDVTIDPRQ